MPVPPVRVGAMAPDFVAVDVEGRRVRLASFRRRRNVVLVLTNTFG